MVRYSFRLVLHAIMCWKVMLNTVQVSLILFNQKMFIHHFFSTIDKSTEKKE